MTDFIVIFIGACLVNNLVLDYLLGVCPGIAQSRKIEIAIGMSYAMVFVLTIATLVSYPLKFYLLVPLRLEFLELISFVFIITVAILIAEKLLQNFAHLPAWEARVAELGEGDRQPIDVAEAHGVARESQPDLGKEIDADDAQGLEAGMPVTVAPDDFSLRGAVEGTLLRVSVLELAIHRSTDDFGDLVIQFPRLGYRVEPLAG